MKTPGGILIKYLILVWMAMLFQVACEREPETNDSSQALANSPRIVAIGDLHGDMNATRRAFRLAGAINEHDQWNGNDLIVVQTGDQLDRGDDELEILQFLERLTLQAKKASGQVYILNGNHEYMNAELDFRYVTPKGFETFVTLPNLNLSQPALSQVPDVARPRAAALMPGGPYAQKLAKRKTILQLGNHVFVHGGVLPAHVQYGIENINRDYQSWLQGQLPQLPDLLTNEQSPIWTRIYSDTETPPDCQVLKQALQALKAKRMIVAHTVQKIINSGCDGQIWRIDVGMAKAYGGAVQVLEIRGEQVRVLQESVKK